MQERKIDLSHLAKNWTSTIIARSEVKLFTGGLVTQGYIANLDSMGKGPEGRIRIGRKIGYLVDPFIKWLESRSEIIEKRSKHNSNEM
jgi:hypothetical protein